MLEDRGAEDTVPEQPQVEERRLAACHPEDRERARHDRDDERRGGDRQRAAGLVTDERQGQQAGRERDTEQDRADHVERAAAGRHIPVRRRGPDGHRGQERERGGDVEHPPPARRQRVDERASPDPVRVERVPEPEPLEDEGAEHRPEGHAQERGGTDEAQCPGARMPTVQVARASGGQRQQGPGARALEDPRQHELLEVLCGAAEQRPSGEDEERGTDEPGQAEAVGCPPRERHRRDECDEVGVDDQEARRSSVQPARSRRIRGSAAAVMKIARSRRAGPPGTGRPA